MRHFGKRSTGQYMRTIYGGIVVQWLQTFFASVRLMLPNPTEKAFICRHDICTPPRNTMPEQFPLYLNPQTNIHTEITQIQKGIIPPLDAIIVFVPVCQQIRFHTLTFPPFRRPPGRQHSETIRRPLPFRHSIRVRVRHQPRTTPIAPFYP